MSEVILKEALKWNVICGMALFSGAAFYINVAHLPAIIAESTVAKQLEAWVKMYAHAAPVQGTLVTVSSVSALALGYLSKNPRWYHIGLLSAAIIPYTMFVMKPLVNDPLHEAEAVVQRDPTITTSFEFADKAKKHLNLWGLLHTVRTIASGTALVLSVRLASKLITY
eukprot:Phypoly_transcript_19807.p1 GENE.Phypoly_transcript_19807~~Phypoly_transcript_19807.p1  ORF type:complete len:168 (+),score=24.79 Phypoly_transcript_19807:122-625(+)